MKTNYKIDEVHISTIRSGDTINHLGINTTVCNNNIKRCDFMGISIFGDTYKLGTMLIKKVTYILG